MLKDLELIADNSGPYPWLHTFAGNAATKPVWDALNNQELTVQEALPEAVKLLNGVLEEFGHVSGSSLCFTAMQKRLGGFYDLPSLFFVAASLSMLLTGKVAHRVGNGR